MWDAAITMGWIFGIILAIMWMFLPWILIAKIDEVVLELQKINKRFVRRKGG